MRHNLLVLTSLVVALSSGGAAAADKAIKLKVPASYTVLNYASSNAAVETSSTGGSLTMTVPDGNKGRVYLLDAETNQLAGNVILGIRVGGKLYSWKAAKAARVCRRSTARAVYGYKVGGNVLNLGTLKVASGYAYALKELSRAQLDLTALGTVTAQCAPTGTAATLGYGTASARAIQRRALISIFSGTEDNDSDGLLNIFDADDDDDGVLDPYDINTLIPTPTAGTVATNLKIFTNNKPSIQSSINAYTQTLTDAALDDFVERTTLAIQVAGGSTLATELDCGTLGYCSSGGTGTSLVGSAPFPDSVDADSDGKGTLTVGATGDFQLATNASSRSAISAGDILVEEVDNGDGTTTSVATMLTFVFNTAPAVASVVMGGVTTTPVYPATSGMLGSENNAWQAPVGWDQKLTITAYRPQRPGISGAGEGTYVDIGGSNIGIDLPNAPCSASLSGGCPGQNTSRCTASSYTESDSNLSADGDKLLDTRADQDTDTTAPSSNQVTFTVDLSTCLSETWDSGEKLGIDLQFSNDIGDNAAQKFYIKLP